MPDCAGASSLHSVCSPANSTLPRAAPRLPSPSTLWSSSAAHSPLLPSGPPSLPSLGIPSLAPQSLGLKPLLSPPSTSPARARAPPRPAASPAQIWLPSAPRCSPPARPHAARLGSTYRRAGVFRLGVIHVRRACTMRGRVGLFAGGVVLRASLGRSTRSPPGV